MYTKILVAVDGSATSDRGLREATSLAKHLGAKLLLVHVIDPYPMLSGMEFVPPDAWRQYSEALRTTGKRVLEGAHRAAAAADVAVEDILDEGGASRVADVITETARSRACDLIVMGTHGRRGFSHLAMGSDAERVARQSQVPLLLVRHAETAAR